MSKKAPLTVDEENDEKAKFAGMTKAQIEAARSAIETQKTKASQASGDLSAKLDIFEKGGGHKKGMRWAAHLASLEPDAAADLWRAVEGYSRALGVFDQIDMFEQEQKNAANALSIVKASKPLEGEENSISTH